MFWRSLSLSCAQRPCVLFFDPYFDFRDHNRRVLPWRQCPPCWRSLASRTSTEASWWAPSSPYTATTSWWRGNSPTAPETLQTGKGTWENVPHPTAAANVLLNGCKTAHRFLSSISIPILRLSFSALPAMKRFALGFLFLVIYAIFSPYFPDSYFLTDEFEVRTDSTIKSHSNLHQFAAFSSLF